MSKTRRKKDDLLNGSPLSGPGLSEAAKELALMSGSNEGAFNVCGVLVHVQPDQIDDTEQALNALPGVEVHDRAEGARLVVTLEDTEERSAADSLALLNKQPGVVAAALIYHEMQPADDAGDSAMEEVSC
ncbi:chaperone NapD [Rhodovibrionaceae bacterium A322]